MNDTIDVKHVQEVHDGVRFDKIVLVLNGEQFNRVLDPFAFITSAHFKQSLQTVITCSCGDSGCAGVFSGVNIKCRRYNVEWRDIDCQLPKRFYRFKLENYLNCVEQTRKYLTDIAQFRTTLDYNFSDEHCDSIYCDTVNEINCSIEWYVNYTVKYQSYVKRNNRSLV